MKRSSSLLLKSLGTWALTCSLFTAGILQAQTEEPAPRLLPSALGGPAADKIPPPPPAAIVDPMVQKAGCCSMPPSHGAGSFGCGSNGCVPGRPPCLGCNSDTHIGRLFGGFYDSICCPDPCYEPRWIAEANSAFFQDSPRPVTQTRVRWDSVSNHAFPDSAEFFWAQIGKKGPKNATPSVRYGELALYQEIAAKGASTFFEMPYRSIESGTNPSQAGFTDMNVGVKSVMLDRELLLISMQFKTIIPVGNPTNGLGIGHVALEPSLLAALKLGPNTYLQAQFADWIPLGGTPGFAGSVIHYHAAINHNLYQQGDCIHIVGSLELNGYSFRGMFTDFPGGALEGLGGTNYLNAGPGIRMIFCDRCDFGVGMGFGFGSPHGPGQIYRTELRLRF